MCERRHDWQLSSAGEGAEGFTGRNLIPRLRFLVAILWHQQRKMAGFVTQIHILASFLYSSDGSTIFIYVKEPKEQLKHPPNVLPALKNKYLPEDSNNN